MLYVNVNRNRANLEEMTKLILAAFPGSTVYQHTDHMNAVKDIFGNKVDAVFLDAQDDTDEKSEFVFALNKRKADIPVVLIYEKDGEISRDFIKGVTESIVRPVTVEKLCEKVSVLKKKTF